MPRLSTLIIAFFIGALFGRGAQAQTLQPTYVRPSKGAAVTILSAPASNATTTYTASAIFDWTAFAGVIVTVNAPTPTPPATACRYGVRVKAFGSPTTSKNDGFMLNVANNDYTTNVSQAWYVRVLPGYLYFQMETYDAAPAATACSGAFKVSITPLPFDYAGPLSSTGVKSTSGGSFEYPSNYTFESTYPYNRLQCLETDLTGCKCAPVINGAPAAYSIFLNPAGTSNQYGGVVEINNWVGTMQCFGALAHFRH